MKHELQRIISGKSEVRNGTAIQAAASYLKRSQRTSKLAKESKLYKKQETEVRQVYETELARLKDGARITDYLQLFAGRRARASLMRVKS